MKIKIIGILVCFAFSATTAYSQRLNNTVDSLSYALGVLYGINIQASGFQTINAEIFGQVVRKVMHNEAVDMTHEEAGMIANAQFQKIQRSRFEKNLNEGRAFLNSNKNVPGVVALPSGLQYKIVKPGTGAKPSATDKVTVHYHGMLINGTVFDSSVERGQPIELSVNQVISGWIEALQLMPVGSKWILYIPSELAYGENPPRGPIEPNSTLIFEVELLSIN